MATAQALRRMADFLGSVVEWFAFITWFLQ